MRTIAADTPVELYVAPNGHDRWSGLLPEPNEDESDGPFAAVEDARNCIQEMKLRGLIKDPVTVYIRGGVYPLYEPITFEPEDSFPVTYRAYPGEEPVFIGSRAVESWEDAKLNSKKAWRADMSLHLQKWPEFNTIFVNDQRKGLARYPKEGYFTIESIPELDGGRNWFYGGATNYFCFHDGDVEEWDGIEDGHAVIKHLWVEERLPVTSVDMAKKRIFFDRSSIFSMALGDETDYWFENVRQFVTEPGEWYLDKDEQALYYLPADGQTPENTEIMVPVLYQFVRFNGRPDESDVVQHICLDSLTFKHTDWTQPYGWGWQFDPHVPEEEWHEDPVIEVPGTRPDPMREKANVPQSAANLPGTIAFRGAKNCSIENCRVEKAGFYAVDIGEGCSGIRVVGNELTDLGAGGVRVSGCSVKGPQELRTGFNLISDNHIHLCGEVFLAGAGVALMHTFDNRVLHNHIHDLYYCSVLVGWTWGYTDTVCRHNEIGYNHLHDIGKGYISDMGGVYVLGEQPGTRIHHNLVHDVLTRHYGGWGIYLDEGSSHVIVEDNIVHHTRCAAFNVHWSRECVIRNNIWAFGGEGLVSFAATEDHRPFTFERNIVLADGQAVYTQGYDVDMTNPPFTCDLNCYWEVNGAFAEDGIFGAGRRKWPDAAKISVSKWLENGNDVHSLFTDPLFTDVAANDFSLKPESPVFEKIGFKPIDLSELGPRPAAERKWGLPKLRKRYRNYRLKHPQPKAADR